MALAQNTLCSSYRIIWLGLFFNFIYMICPIYLTLFQLFGEISSDDTSEKKTARVWHLLFLHSVSGCAGVTSHVFRFPSAIR